jgi:hypothetical protein
MLPEQESHHEAHRTGHHLADRIVAFSAIFISVCSLALAIHHGHTMERLVEANSRPFLEFDTNNAQIRPSGEVVREFSATISNPGTGSARIERFSIALDNTVVTDWREALQRLKGEAVAKQLMPDGALPAGELTYSTVAPGYLKGGGEQTIVRWLRSDSNAVMWDYLDAARQAGRITLQACYCSMFDECWIVRSAAFRPTPVAQCS